MITKEQYKIFGMKKDNIIGNGESSKFAYEIKNMRLNTVGDSTTAIWSTENGTKEKEIIWFGGDVNFVDIPLGENDHYSFENLKPIGQCAINETWILFCVSYTIKNFDEYLTREERKQYKGHDFIIKIFYDKNNTNRLTGRILYYGDLNFNEDYPIETIPYYENEYIQKVYWIDGQNQPRMINVGYKIEYPGEHRSYFVNKQPMVNTRFDFVRETSLKEKVDITKVNTGGGLFPPGTVKYLLTYYNEYEEETNVVYESPLYYPTMGERACHPDEISCNVFRIEINNLDLYHNFDYMRLYSVIRTTENTTPIVRIVKEIKLKDVSSTDNKVIILDSNTTGEIVDPSIVQYIGGNKIIPYTFEQKDNTLFLGYYRLDDQYAVFTDADSKSIAGSLHFVAPYKTDTDIIGKPLKISEVDNDKEMFYNWVNQLNTYDIDLQLTDNEYDKHFKIHDGSSQQIKHFKRGDYYLFGMQFQDNTGKWSDVYPIRGEKDTGLQCDIKPLILDWKSDYVLMGEATCKIPNDARQQLINLGYKKARMVCCYPNVLDRTVIAQGVINPTMYNKQWRANKTPSVFSSYFFRPNDNPDFFTETISNVIGGSGHWTNPRNLWPSVIETNNIYCLGKNYIPFQHEEPLKHNYTSKEVKITKDMFPADPKNHLIALALMSLGMPSAGLSLLTAEFFSEFTTIFSTSYSYTITQYLYDNSEIQSIYPSDTRKEDPDNASSFFVDRTIFTMHSPDFEIDERLLTLPLDDPKINVIGWVPISSWSSSMYVDASGPKTVFRGTSGKGFEKRFETVIHNKAHIYGKNLMGRDMPKRMDVFASSQGNRRCGSHTMSPGFWNDTNIYFDIGGGWFPIDYPFYPFQRMTQLNNWVKDISDWEVVYKKNDDYEQLMKASGLFTAAGLANAIMNPAMSPIYAIIGTITFIAGKSKKGNSQTSTKITTTGGAKLNKKRLSHLLVSDTTYYFDDSDIYNLTNTQEFNIVNISEVLPTKMDLKNPDGTPLKYNYYGNVNTLAPLMEESIVSLVGDIKTINEKSCHNKTDHPNGSIVDGKYWIERYGKIGYSRDLADCWPSSDPVPIAFKSKIHGLFQTNEIKDFLDDKHMPQTKKVSKYKANNDGGEEPFLWLVEVCKDIDEQNRFNGLVGNVYYPCGPSYSLEDNNEYLWYQRNVKAIDTNGNLTLEAIEGDTYYMRYDHMKTYPFSIEDPNQIVEILSFMCESRINLDGRYDTQRGLTDNTTVVETNFNFVNKSYTQSNNLFAYQRIEKIQQRLDEFSNQITWTKTKHSGERVDTWTNTTLASIAEADGSKGKITKICNINDNLVLFQERGIASIGYNEKTAISTTDGIPLEIANSNKFTGLKYIIKDVGCRNKWSISKTKNGVMFIDDYRKQLFALGGENKAVTEISTINDMDSFFIKQLPVVNNSFEISNYNVYSYSEGLIQKNIWSPYAFNNFVTYYDKVNKDIYYLNKDYCLAWNEVSNTFTSFYSYNNVPYMSNIGEHFLMWKNFKIYAAREGDKHCWFFDKYENFWITLVCDGVTEQGYGFTLDKVFNNIEYNGDVYNKVNKKEDIYNGTPINQLIFNKVAAWNGYQLYNEFDIQEDRLQNRFQINSERKFNTWRVQLPRATYKNEYDQLYTNRDRIRGHWSFIKLLNDDAVNNFVNTMNGNRALIHDFAVFYDMK